MTQRTSRFAGAVLAGIAALALASCAGQAPETANPSATDGETAAQPVSIGLFVANAFGDHSYYDAAFATIADLENDLGATVTTYEGKLETQNYAPLLQDAADVNQLVFVVGNQAIDATVAAAADNADTTFVFVNGVVSDASVVSVAYRYAESCYVGGTIAALVSEGTDATAVGFMGGFEAPSMADCEAGLTQGVAALAPELSVVSQFVGSFSDPGKGLETATALAQQGAYVVYSSAGLSGQGAVKAAESGVEIAPILAASADVPDVSPAVVNDDTAVLILDAAQGFVDGTLKKGEVRTYGWAEGAFIVDFNPAFLDAAQQASVQAVIADITAGKITPTGAAR
ncbi:BMP family lipoprotein [Microbacterium sp.]|uniref:BMP family lipoprotein n=1 Tax=Microbacterium sp. TaxID=51671 RepID=UPI0039E53F8C